jgi:hypothetical protein
LLTADDKGQHAFLGVFADSESEPAAPRHANEMGFLEQAQRAAREIPMAEFLALGDANHYAAHTSQDELLLDAVLRTLRANS